MVYENYWAEQTGNVLNEIYVYYSIVKKISKKLIKGVKVT